MAFVALGTSVAGFFGADAIGAAAAGAIGSGLVGAGTGAVLAGIQGKNILNGALMGGGLGAIGGGIAGAMNPALGQAANLAPAVADATSATGYSGGVYPDSGSPTGYSDINGQQVSSTGQAVNYNNSGQLVDPNGNVVTPNPPAQTNTQTGAPTGNAGVAPPGKITSNNPSFFKDPLAYMQANPGKTLLGLGAIGALGYSAFGNKSSNLIPAFNPVQPAGGIASAGMSPSYRGYFQAKEGGIAQLAHGGMAHGGKAEYNLGSYSDGGRLLKGPGDGMSDEIPATIAHKQPARLAEGEFVVPADVVSHLGNGSTDAGAKHLYKMMDNVRMARTGKKKQGKQIKADKFLPT
jgi:hypothetical protein